MEETRIEVILASFRNIFCEPIWYIKVNIAMFLMALLYWNKLKKEKPSQ